MTGLFPCSLPQTWSNLLVSPVTRADACAARQWNSDGSALAVAGLMREPGGREVAQVQFYAAFGNHLRTLQVRRRARFFVFVQFRRLKLHAYLIPQTRALVLRI